MKKTAYTFASLAVMLSLSTTLQAAFIDYQLSGTTDRDEWNTLDRASNTHNRYRVGQGNWTSAANAIQSNTQNGVDGPWSGNARLNPLAGNTNGFSASTAAPAGLTGAGWLRVTDDIPLTAVKTVVFQLDYNVLSAASTEVPGSLIVGQPLLRLDGALVGGDGLADYTEAHDRQVVHPSGSWLVPAGNYAWQWDLTGVAFETGALTIEWNTPQNGTLLNGIRLDQSTVFEQVVGIPEPGSFAMLTGAGLLLLAFRRSGLGRRMAAKHC